MLLTEYDYETDVRVQREEARREGVSQGSRQKAIETARKMKHMGLSDELIAQATSLEPEEVSKICRLGN